MREFIEDALNHSEDGYGRVQKAQQVELPKRFYATVSVGEQDGAFVVLLDGRPTRTPGKKTLILVPTAALAQLLAEEWSAQAERIDPRTMPVVRLVNSAIESGEALLPEFRAEVVKFAASDLLLYRADTPRELVADQEKHWDGALVRLARHFGVAFQPTIGIVHQAQPPATLQRLAQAVDAEPLLASVAMVSITSLTGSGLLAIALRQKLLSPDEVWTAAHVDEDHQARLWGVDEEAELRRNRRRAEFEAAVKVLDALQSAR